MLAMAMASSSPSSAIAGTRLQVKGIPTLRPARSGTVNVRASGKKIKVDEPLGPCGGTNFKEGKDASGRVAKGKGVYQFVNKYGANVDGYSPIYDPKDWSPSGDVYTGGKTGLIPPINRIYTSHTPTTFRPHISTANRRARTWRCQVTNEEVNQDAKTEDKSSKVVDTVVPNKRINRRIGFASISAAVGLFLSTRGWFGGVVSLSDLSVSAVPYDEALTNGMPTMVEFYADWCEVCRELAPDVYKVEQEFKDRVNFVMLNVDNTKWEEEIDEFGVEGIPHFSFLDKDGNEEGNVVGRIPKQYLAENLAALTRGDKQIPHSRFVGKFSKAEVRQVHPVANPRGHSNM